MRTVLKKLMILSTFSIPMYSSAGEVQEAKILEIRQRASSAVIRFDKNFDTACTDGGRWALFTSDGSPHKQQMWSLILSAAAAGKTVTVRSEKCDYHNLVSEIFVHY